MLAGFKLEIAKMRSEGATQAEIDRMLDEFEVVHPLRMAQAARPRVREYYTVTRLADDVRKLYAACCV